MTNVDLPISGVGGARELERVIELRGKLAVLLCDNGSECTSKALDCWDCEHGIPIDFFRPGKPTQNAYGESFNGRMRDECASTITGSAPSTALVASSSLGRQITTRSGLIVQSVRKHL